MEKEESASFLKKRSKKLLVYGGLLLPSFFKLRAAGYLLLMVFVSVPADAAPSSWLQSQTSGMVEISRPFVQSDFGYSVKAPPGGAAFVGGGGTGDNGLLIILGYRREISVSPEYLVMDPPPEPCDASQWPFLTGQVGLVARTKLDLMSACQVAGRHGDVVWHLVEAERNDRGTMIMYALLLTTTSGAARRDEASFQAVIRNFRFVRISP